MRVKAFVCAAIVAAMVPAVALADDPRDPTMRSAAARARDSETTRQLNLAAGAVVRERDARQMRQMQGWRAPRDGDSYEVADNEYVARSQDYNARTEDHAQTWRTMPATVHAMSRTWRNGTAPWRHAARATIRHAAISI
jgi:hypothetical protein